MSVYHFENGQLVKLHEDLSEIIDEDQEGNPDAAFARAGFMLAEEVEGAYVGYVTQGNRADNGPLAGYAYAFTVEDIGTTLPWTVLVRNDLSEYAAAMRLMEPLFSRLTFLEIESEVKRRIEKESQEIGL